MIINIQNPPHNNNSIKVTEEDGKQTILLPDTSQDFDVIMGQNSLLITEVPSLMYKETEVTQTVGTTVEVV